VNSPWENRNHLFCRKVSFLNAYLSGAYESFPSFFAEFMMLSPYFCVYYCRSVFVLSLCNFFFWPSIIWPSSNPFQGEMYSIQHFMRKFVSDLQQLCVFFGVSGFLYQKNWPPRYNWNIVESSVKHYKPKPPKHEMSTQRKPDSHALEGPVNHKFVCTLEHQYLELGYFFPQIAWNKPMVSKNIFQHLHYLAVLRSTFLSDHRHKRKHTAVSN
jgi:hypothetical protein